MDFIPSPCCQQRYELFTLAIKGRLHNADDDAYVSYRISTGACAFDTMGSFFTAANHHQSTYSCAITSLYRCVRGFRTHATPPPPATTWVLLALTLGMLMYFIFRVDRHRQLQPSFAPSLPQIPSAQGFFPKKLLAYDGLPFLAPSSSASTTWTSTYYTARDVYIALFNDPFSRFGHMSATTVTHFTATTSSTASSTTLWGWGVIPFLGK